MLKPLTRQEIVELLVKRDLIEIALERIDNFNGSFISPSETKININRQLNYLLNVQDIKLASNVQNRLRKDLEQAFARGGK